MSGPLSICITIQSLPEWTPAAPTSTVLHPPLASLRCFAQVGTDTGLGQGWAPSRQLGNAHFLLACPFLQRRALKSCCEQGGYKIHPNYTTSIWAAWEAGTESNLNPQQLQPHHSPHSEMFLTFLFLAALQLLDGTLQLSLQLPT